MDSSGNCMVVKSANGHLKDITPLALTCIIITGTHYCNIAAIGTNGKL
jgi:hypothetical protein